MGKVENKATFNQAFQLLNLIRQKDPTLAGLNRLYQSGFLSDLFDANLSAVDRQTFRQLLHLEALASDGKPANILTVDYDQNLEQMIATGNYGDDGKGNNWCRDINARRFPIVGKGKVEFEHKLLHFGCFIFSEDVMRRIFTSDVAIPWEPAKIEHITAYGAKYPEEQRKYPIVGLGSVGEVFGKRRVSRLSVVSNGRALGIDGWDDYWYAYYRFLVVRRIVPQPTAS